MIDYDGYMVVYNVFIVNCIKYDGFIVYYNGYIVYSYDGYIGLIQIHRFASYGTMRLQIHRFALLRSQKGASPWLSSNRYSFGANNLLQKI